MTSVTTGEVELHCKMSTQTTCLILYGAFAEQQDSMMSFLQHVNKQKKDVSSSLVHKQSLLILTKHNTILIDLGLTASL